MEPIISPWIIYGIGAINNLWVVAVLAIIISCLGTLVVILGNSCIDEQDIKILKILSVVFSMAVILLVVLPSKNTMLTMLALYYVTPDNVQAVQGNIVDFVNQIANAIKNVK